MVHPNDRTIAPAIILFQPLNQGFRNLQTPTGSYGLFQKKIYNGFNRIIAQCQNCQKSKLRPKH